MTNKLNNFVLILQAFSPGGTISGKLHFTLDETKCYHFVIIGLHGSAVTTVATRSGSTETYVKHTTVLWNHQQSSNGTIGPGTFDFDFQFTLPIKCPRSFAGRGGQIKYVLRGNIFTGEKSHLSYQTELPIQVCRTVDVNLPQLMAPMYRSIQKKVGFSCFGNNVELTVNLPHTGFCVGEKLPLTVSVKNNTSHQIKLRATILRMTKYLLQMRPVYEREKLAVVASPEIATHSPYTWSVDNLTIPQVEPSFEGSKIIQMRYLLKVTAVIPWARDCAMLFPLTLGNIKSTSD